MYNSAKKSEQESLVQYGLIVFRCFCHLIERLSHFNYANEILETIVNNLTSKISQVFIFPFLNSILKLKRIRLFYGYFNFKIASMAFEIITNLFKSDKTLQLSFDVKKNSLKILVF